MKTENGWVEISVPDEVPHPAVMGAYVARPDAPGVYPGVVIAPELFGVNGHIEEVTRRIAALGYVAVAPDFHHRTEPGAALPYGDEGRAHGFELIDRLTRDGVVRDAAAAMAYLREHESTTGRVGMVGFSVGGHFAFIAAARLDLAVTAAFYPGWLTSTDIPISRPEPSLGLAAGIKGRLLILVGGADHAVTGSQVEQIGDELTAAGVRHELVVYPDTPHGFFCDERDTYRPEIAEDSWRRLTDLLSDLR